MPDMNPAQDSFSRENTSGKLFVMTVILVIILGGAFLLISIFKPETRKFSTAKGEIKDTPKEHIEKIETLILKVNNLTNEARLFDELFDELVYTESPAEDRIGDFVSNFKNFAALYTEDKNAFSTSDWISKDYDSTIISLERQQKFLGNSIVNLLKSMVYKKKIIMTIPITFPIPKKMLR